MLYTEKKVDIAHERFGGTGDVIMEHYFDETQINDKIGMYAKVTMKPGCGLGYHQHKGTTETVVVLEGVGELNDDGEIMTIKKGDVVFCAEGHYHSIRCHPESNVDLVLQALVAKV